MDAKSADNTGDEEDLKISEEEKHARVRRILAFFLFATSRLESSGQPVPEELDMVHSAEAVAWREDPDSRAEYQRRADELMRWLDDCGVSFSARAKVLQKKLRTLATIPAALAYQES